MGNYLSFTRDEESAYYGYIKDHKPFSKKTEQRFLDIRDDLRGRISKLTKIINKSNSQKENLKDKLMNYQIRYERVKELFIRNNMNLLFSFVTRNSGFYPSIEDDELFSEGQVKLISCYESFKKGKSKFSTYFYKAMEYTAKNLTKKSRNYKLRFPINMFRPDEDSKSSDSSNYDEREHLENCIDAETIFEKLRLKKVLSGREMKVVKLHFGFSQREPYSFKRIGEEIGLSTMGAYNIFNGALLKMKIALR